MPPIPVQPADGAADADADVLRLRPEIEELARLVEFIEESGERLGLTFKDVHAVTLAAEELFANTLSHGGGTAAEFSLAVDAGVVTAVYRDDGAAFDPTALAEVDTTLAAEDRGIGGLGIHFIRKMMTRFEYRREGGWNVITFGRG